MKRLTVPTAQSLTRTSRWLDRRRREAGIIVSAMRDGATLHLQFSGSGSCWRLSTGLRVASDVAAIVCADSHVVGVGDALFAGMTSQTFRYNEEKTPC